MEEKNTIAAIAGAVARVFDVPADEIRGHGKARILTDARYLAMYMAREKGEYTFRIADYFGVTPQAVCAGINRTTERLKLYPSLRARLARAMHLFDNSL